jgi:hypothetical protein
MLSGSLTAGGRTLTVSGRLTGDQINFSAGSARYMGRVNGERIEGTMQNGLNAQAWRAVRVTK